MQEMSDETKRMYKLSATLKRICTPKEASGKLEVSPEVHKQWLQGGEPRKALLRILIKNGGDKEFELHVSLGVLCMFETLKF